LPPSPEPDSRSDQTLITLCNQGDPAAFEALYYRYRDWVVRLAGRFTGNADDALDCLQDTFTYLYKKFPGFTLTAGMTTFLYPVVKNTSIRIRQKRRRLASGDDVLEQTPAPPSPPDPAVSDLAAIVARLPDAQREVVLMRFVDGMMLEEIAAALAIPLGTVKSRLHHGLNALRIDERTRRYFED
jgi:RNA polymerase sigma-70 factor (ECF subfamily)